jgi:hypothetical protein
MASAESAGTRDDREGDVSGDKRYPTRARFVSRMIKTPCGLKRFAGLSVLLT